MDKAEWGGNPVCRWFGLHFCFACCLDEASCTGCYWWLGFAGSCIQVVSLLWFLTIWYSLGLGVLCIMPRVRVPKTERIRCPQQCKSIKGFYCQLEPGLPSHPVQWSLDESPKPRFTAVFISLEQRQGVGKGWLAAGVSWYLLIGQSSSLWLARVIISLIGQSYPPRKHDSGIIFGLVHLSEPVMALVRL